jgi:catechol 2,3-dioxygenase-like lactoylglutathione lyase family enzyme
MTATGLNHVSVVAQELATSIRFYAELFGARPVPTPEFGYPVQWLAVGDAQLHLFERPDRAPTYHHFALTVNDFEAVYARGRELGAFDADAFGHHLYELPGDVAQLYLRDPAGNLVEVDAPAASALPPPIRSELRRLADVHRQSPDNMRARLALGSAGTPA